MKIILFSFLIVVCIFFVNLILYKLADIFAWRMLPEKTTGISKKQYSYFLFKSKKLDSDEFTDSMEKIWKNTDLSVFRKLLDI